MTAPPPRKPITAAKARRACEYRRQGWTIAEIAACLGMSESSVDRLTAAAHRECRAARNARIRALRRKGRTLREIAADLDVCIVTVRRALGGSDA